MRVDARVHEEVNDPDTEALSLRISAALPPAELRALVGQTLSDFQDRWDASPPELIYNTGAPPPELAVEAIPPDVAVRVDKVTDLPTSFELLIAALDTSLPEDARVSQLSPVRLLRQPVAALELRLALQAERQLQHWNLESDSAATVDRLASTWLLANSSSRAYLRITGGFVEIADGRVAETLRATRDEGASALVVSNRGGQVRALHYGYRSAHVSFIAGHSEPARIERATYNDIMDILDVLGSIIQTAFIRFTDDIESTGPAAHDDRHLWKLATRQHLRDDRERALEENGLVDAQGIVYLSTVPSGISPDWTQRPFGHLTCVEAPDLSAWLAHRPSAETIAQGRQALAPLLGELVS